MAKLSEPQIAMLRFIEVVTSDDKMRCRPGWVSTNQITHKALLRKGLVKVDAEGYVNLTEAGKASLVRELK